MAGGRPIQLAEPYELAGREQEGHRILGRPWQPAQQQVAAGGDEPVDEPFIREHQPARPFGAGSPAARDRVGRSEGAGQ